MCEPSACLEYGIFDKRTVDSGGCLELTLQRWSGAAAADDAVNRERETRNRENEFTPSQSNEDGAGSDGVVLGYAMDTITQPGNSVISHPVPRLPPQCTGPLRQSTAPREQVVIPDAEGRGKYPASSGALRA